MPMRRSKSAVAALCVAALEGAAGFTHQGALGRLGRKSIVTNSANSPPAAEGPASSRRKTVVNSVLIDENQLDELEQLVKKPSLTNNYDEQHDEKRLTSTLILVRHGESIWNGGEGERFTGWSDVPLSPRGEDEAAIAGAVLKEHGVQVDSVWTSALQRARDTAEIVLDTLGCDARVEERWQLNERHYGALQGLNKLEVERALGSEVVQRWRRDLDSVPPPMTEDHELFSEIYDNPRYAHIPHHELPRAESVEMCLDRLAPVWSREIAPALARGEVVMVCAHANSLRALLKHIYADSDDVDAQLRDLRIPTAVPLLYQLKRRPYCDMDGSEEADDEDEDSQPCILGPDPSMPLYEFIPQPPPDSCGFLSGEWLYPLEQCPILYDDRPFAGK